MLRVAWGEHQDVKASTFVDRQFASGDTDLSLRRVGYYVGLWKSLYPSVLNDSLTGVFTREMSAGEQSVRNQAQSTKDKGQTSGLWRFGFKFRWRRWRSINGIVVFTNLVNNLQFRAKLLITAKANVVSALQDKLRLHTCHQNL